MHARSIDLERLQASCHVLFACRHASWHLVEDLFLGGTDTTSQTVEWTMAELVKNPNEMEKVQAEVREVVGPHGSVSESRFFFPTG